MNFAVLDFETTGNQPNDDIIQVGIVRVENGQIAGEYHSFVKPQTAIPPFISRLTGITEDQVKDAPMLDEVISNMLPLLNDCALVGHHVAFDYGFLNRALYQCGYGPFQGFVFDLIDLLKICYPGLSGHKLSMVTDHFNIPHDRPHRADSDALATAYLWNMCIEKLESLPLITLQRILTVFEPSRDEITHLLEQLVYEKELSTSIADTDDLNVYRRFHLRAGDWKEEEPARDGETIFEYEDFPAFVEHLQDEWSKSVENFESRSEQVHMMKEVFEALDDGQHLLVEAGTGTGKSLGYLIPALYHGIRNEQKIVVSTHTINLQEQLNKRDIPLLHQLFPVAFRSAVFKGRGHYLCLRKFEQKINTQDYEQRKDDRIAAAQMIVWLGETEHGDDEELNLNNISPNFWQTISSDADSCLNRACPWFSKCFYHRARHEAQIADVVITNHSLLFTDVKAEHRLLPSYDHLIVDEAHHFEEVAENHLGTSLNYFSVAHSLSWLYKDKLNGSLPALIQQLTGSGMENEEKWIETIENVLDRVTKCKEHWDTLASGLYDWLAIRAKPGSTEGGQLVARMDVKEGVADDPIWEPIVHAEQNVHAELGEIVRMLDRLLTELKEENDDFELQSLITDIAGSVKDLSRYRDEVHFLIERNKDDFVYWLEAASAYRMKSLELTAVPIDVSPLLREYFFDRKESIVLTSATLTVDKSFQYVSHALGLLPYENTGRLKTVQLDSPFNYRKQALVCIPRDFPKLKGISGQEEFVEKLSSSLDEVARITQGRMLVLFTSYRMLKETYSLLKEKLADSEIEVFGQGIDSSNRSKLTERFMKAGASVLLGTGSFWEGVDMPGDALVCLAIVRLPFQPPNHPVVEAKCERIKARNQNPFIQYSVPQAVIRFKQGFGRLVRSSQDKGIVIIYDTRVIEQRYGKNFLYSLPGPKMEHMRLDQLANRVDEWMGSSEEENKG